MTLFTHTTGVNLCLDCKHDQLRRVPTHQRCETRDVVTDYQLPGRWVHSWSNLDTGCCGFKGVRHTHTHTHTNKKKKKKEKKKKLIGFNVLFTLTFLASYLFKAANTCYCFHQEVCSRYSPPPLILPEYFSHFAK